jgi:predicted acylesterase/phospholipase RssA
MVKLLKPEDVAYDVMTGKRICDRAGASVGALNGLMFAAHEKGAEVEVAHKMTQLWKTVEQGSIFQHWPILGPILGLISKTSFFDNSPELPYLRTRLQAEGGQIKRRMTIGIADAQTGDYLIINSSTGAKDWPYYIVGSSSVPGFFVPMIVGNRVWIDGGTLNNLNLRGGIAECLDIGAAVEDIVIDVVMTNPCTSTD